MRTLLKTTLTVLLTLCAFASHAAIVNWTVDSGGASGTGQVDDVLFDWYAVNGTLSIDTGDRLRYDAPVAANFTIYIDLWNYQGERHGRSLSIVNEIRFRGFNNVVGGNEIRVGRQLSTLGWLDAPHGLVWDDASLLLGATEQDCGVFCIGDWFYYSTPAGAANGHTVALIDNPNTNVSAIGFNDLLRIDVLNAVGGEWIYLDVEFAAQAAVPVPPAIALFGSAIIGLVGIARKADRRV